MSKDDAYGEQGSRAKLERGVGSCKHSVLALSLSTLHTSLSLEVCLGGRVACWRGCAAWFCAVVCVWRRLLGGHLLLCSRNASFFFTRHVHLYSLSIYSGAP